MRNKTRKFIWSAPLVAALAIIGALTLAGVLLLPNADNADAQSATDVPSVVTATPGNTKITVTWQPPTGTGLDTAVTSYEVRYKGAAATDWGTWQDVGNFQARQHVIEGLSNSASYNVQVRAVYSNKVRSNPANADTTGSGSAAEIAPLAGAPGAPGMVAVSQTDYIADSDGNGTADDPSAVIVVSWAAPDDGGSPITGYLVKSSSGGTGATISDSPSEISSDITPDPTVALGKAAESVTITLSGTNAADNTWIQVSVQAQNASGSGGTTASGAAETFDIRIDADIEPNFVDLDFMGSIESSSTSASASPKFTVTLTDLPVDLPVGSSIVLFLEDDYLEPGSIPASSVYFIANNPRSNTTGDGSPVYAAAAPEIDTDGYFDADKDDISIRVQIPDMCIGEDTGACAGPNGPERGQDLTMVIASNSGIKNPSEEGKHTVAFDVLAITEDVPGKVTRLDADPEEDGIQEVSGKDDNGAPLPIMRQKGVYLSTAAKISVSSPDGSRGDELSVTGSGFNNGVSAGVYVLSFEDSGSAYKWNALDCREMILAGTGTMPAACDTSSPWAKMYDGLGAAEKAAVDGTSFFTSGAGEAAFCAAIIRSGTRVGEATVGSDDKVSVSFEVTVPTFMPGNNNYICMVDGEGRTSSTDVEDFKLDPSIRVSPTTANVGDTVTVFAQDFMANDDEDLDLKLASVSSGDKERGFETSGGNIGRDGSGSATFEVPGWAEGTLRVDAWGENTKITVIGSTLNISKSEALPNELLTISGDGFSTDNVGSGDNYVDIENITIDGVPLQVDEDSHTENKVDVSSSGQFVATIALWPEDSSTNPTLTAGVHTIEVVDNNGFSGSVVITIPEPVIKVTPGIAGPRDVVTISGENWPVENLQGGNVAAIVVTVTDGARPRQYSVYADGSGRFFQEHQVHSGVTIPSNSRVQAKYDDLVKLTSYEVPAAIIEVTPGEGQPGDELSLSVDEMPVYSRVSSVEIAGRDVIPVGNFSTDRTGSVTVDGVVIPGLDPGVHSVLLRVSETVAIGSVEVLSEGPIGSETPTAEGLAPVGDSLVAVFYFDNVSKSWDFYDPREEFAELNTLTNLVDGEPYWVLVSEDVDDVELNNKSQSLTCGGGNCWNPVIW